MCLCDIAQSFGLSWSETPCWKAFQFVFPIVGQHAFWRQDRVWKMLRKVKKEFFDIMIFGTLEKVWLYFTSLLGWILEHPVIPAGPFLAGNQEKLFFIPSSFPSTYDWLVFLEPMGLGLVGLTSLSDPHILFLAGLFAFRMHYFNPRALHPLLSSAKIIIKISNYSTG